MNKQEFLNSLRATLGNELGAAAAEENVKYYEEYINSEIRMGKSEAEVLQKLGNPKLIARSIIDAEKNSGTNRTNASGNYGQNAEYRSDESYAGGYNSNTKRSQGNGIKVHKMPLWLVVLLVVAVVFVIFGALVMFVWWLAPIIIVIWLLGFVIKMFKGKK